jgi:signal transduction histidine kinase
MKSRWTTGASYGHLRWVVLLLAVAVILPTVCLLWFMNQVVKNERLAVRQKLITIYRGHLDRITKKTEDRWIQSRRLFDNEETWAHPYPKFVSLIADNNYDGLVVYDAAGKCIYPQLSVSTSRVESSELFSDAWELEFTERRFSRAAELYKDKAEYATGHVHLAALSGRSRCLAKLGRMDDAIEQCKQVAFSPLAEQGDASALLLIGNARLLLLKLTAGNAKYDALFEETFHKLVSMIYAVNLAGAALPADHNLFLAQKVLQIGRESSLLDGDSDPVFRRIQALVTAEERSIRVAEHLPTAASLASWRTDRFQPLQVGQEAVYGLYHQTSDGSMLVLLSGEGVASVLTNYQSSLNDSYVTCSILDDAGRLVAGSAEPAGEAFVTASVGPHLPDWKVELYFRGGDVFERAANERVAVYVWTGLLVIGLILVAGAFAGKAVGKQIKLNKLKNDFIATVSHELKTPLASMRVLVDTLLEGNIKDQRLAPKGQAAEYLQLVSRENERLSRLIDNFLTFSRMERNKQAFVMAKTSPSSIAQAAAEAVATKFRDERCHFEVAIDKDLPDVLADHDAMVTVLVNLLDNAYKYSYDDKHIQLRVSTEDSSVCFCVSDDGAGMSRRAARKIFKRFYQADRSLSRGTGGCGLGLSIAKFIVDAHKGSILVDSKPGEGSTFAVRLPVGN